MTGLVRGLAKEWAPGGVRVNALCPGYTRTDFTAPLVQDAEMHDAVARRIPVGRWAEPDEVAAAALFLCSEEAEYVTGQALVVDGGFLVYY